jgi:hypothetical protein
MRKFKDRGVKGIKYPSTKSSGHNVALFVDPDCIEDEVSDDGWRLGEPLFKLIDSGVV